MRLGQAVSRQIRVVFSKGCSSAHCRGGRYQLRCSTGTHPTVNALLSRSWLLHKPDTSVSQLNTEHGNSIHIVRDELLHPLYGGNKARKLDALIPALRDAGTNAVVTYGGVQSAHTAAVAAASAEAGMSAYLLLRGECPAVPAGNLLVSRLFGQVTHVTRAEYANRQRMVDRHVNDLQSRLPHGQKIAVLHEGGSSPAAMLGLIRLVHFLAGTCLTDQHGSSLCWHDQPCTIVIDSGTGVTAIGIAMGIKLLALPWQVVGVMLAGDMEYYQGQQQALTAAFVHDYLSNPAGRQLDVSMLPLQWLPRLQPRTFGKVLPGELQICKQIARQHGILLDPIYTLAAWDKANTLAQERQGPVIMVHTGGLLGLHGLAQRFTEEF